MQVETSRLEEVPAAREQMGAKLRKIFEQIESVRELISIMQVWGVVKHLMCKL